MSEGQLLAVEGLDAGYGRTNVVRGVDLHVDVGEIVSLIGSNGAGKSTLLKAVVGLVTPSAGTVHFDGRPVTGQKPEKLVAQGVALVPEGQTALRSAVSDRQPGAGRVRDPWRLEAGGG